MIIYKKGDLLKAPEMILAQSCNAQGRMASGIAKAIRAKYPEVYELYHQEYTNHGLFLGNNIPALTQDGKYIIFNMVTQQFYGHDGRQYCNYEAIRTCLKKVTNCVGNMPVAMPKISAGLAGGDWRIISQIIEEEIINPVVYEL
jgi:O-acetyl-ADP-ribose deacetylase (regulator of RNase III)